MIEFDIIYGGAEAGNDEGNESYQREMSRAVTAFEQRVYDQVSLVPEGRVTTYAEMSKALDCHSAQAIGQALKRNPFAPEVPCHRVIRANHTIGGYAGQTGGEKLALKLSLLKSEGVEFDSGGKLVSPEKLFLFSERA